MIKRLLAIIFLLSFVGKGLSQRAENNLPAWGLSVKGSSVQSIDWRTSPPTITDLSNSGASDLGATAIGIDNCGRIAFYLLHTGVDQPNQLHIYANDGTRLTNTVSGSALQALNSAVGNTEIQVVPVPGTMDEWYLIYSKYQTPCNPSGTGTSSAYCPARVVYARIKYNVDVKTLQFLDGKREVSIGSDTYIQGKAVSKTVDGDKNRHYLYLAKRQASVDHLSIHRFIIDSNGITFSASTSEINATYWFFCISGSSIELSCDETKLAITNRNQWTTGTNDSDYEDIIIFDLNQFSSSSPTPAVISVPNLVVESLGKTIKELYTTPVEYNYRCLRYLRNKLLDIEFSPSGRYLYVTGGGYPAQSGVTYNTYLLQIDLLSGAKPNYNTRILVQKGVNVSSDCQGDSFADAGLNNHSLAFIESSFDGRLYFTKDNEHYLFVIPNPDNPMPHNLAPQELDLSTSEVPNIKVNNEAFVVYMPENIDGYDYLPSKDVVDANFMVSKASFFNTEPVTLTMAKFLTTNNYKIKWGDGTEEVMSASSSTHQYNNGGSYDITVTATDQDGCSITSKKTVSVTLCAINLVYSLDRTVTFPKQLITLTIANYTNTNTYQVDWGDGTSEFLNSSIGSHRYTSFKEVPFIITVIVADLTGCSKTVTHDIEVKMPAPLCEFTLPTNRNGTIQLDKFSGEYVYHNDGSCYADIPFGCIQGPSDAPQLKNVVSASATTYSDDWSYDYLPSQSSSTSSSVEQGKVGKWRAKATYTYSKGSVNVDKNYNSGRYQLSHFNWDYPGVSEKQGWLKANEIMKYSPDGDALEERNVLGIYSAAKFGYGGALPYLIAKNAEYSSVMFESFENVYSNGKLEEGVGVNGNAVVSSVSHSGKKSLQLTGQFNSPSFTLSNHVWQKGMLVRVWSRAGSGTDIVSSLKLKLSTEQALQGFSMIARSGEWALYEARIAPQSFGASAGGQVIVSLVNQGGNTLWIDDVRMQPLDAEVTCYVYDVKTLRVLTVFDDQHFGLYYQYNQEGQLVRKQIETVRGIKTVQETQYNVPERDKSAFTGE